MTTTAAKTPFPDFAQVLEAAKRGELDPEWTPFRMVGEAKHGYSPPIVVIDVTAEPLIFQGEWLPVSSWQLQQLADVFDAALLTARIADALHRNADVRVEPVVTVPPGSDNIAATADLADWWRWTWSRYEQGILDLGTPIDGHFQRWPIISGLGKDWVISPRLGTMHPELGTVIEAVNHGFYSASAPGHTSVLPRDLALWQDEGGRHNQSHIDPTQLARLMRRKVRAFSPEPIGYAGTVQDADVADLYNDPVFGPVLTHGRITRPRILPPG